jgi:DNA-binding NarL/FixJ family response regulator
MLRAGISGYLDRASGREDLILAIRAVAAGRPYISPLASESLLEEFPHHVEAPPDADQESDRSMTNTGVLTSREIEVLRLLASGKRCKEIGCILAISAKTVQAHRQNVMDKLEIHSAVELARYALREGLVSI